MSPAPVCRCPLASLLGYHVEDCPERRSFAVPERCVCGHSILRHTFPALPPIDQPPPRSRPTADEYGCLEEKCMCRDFAVPA